MSLRGVERLIAALVSQPEGLDIAAAAAACESDLAASLQELVRRGYRVTRTARLLLLDAAAAHFDPLAFARVRCGTWGSPLEVWESTPSTNDLAHAGAAAGAPHGALWLAEAQTQGRGRQGRTWHCTPHAGLLFSTLLRIPLHENPRPLWLPLALALGACEALRRIGVPARTKWPNDILIGEAKLAGLLLETRSGPAAATIFGFGMNVRADAVRESDGVRAAHLGEFAREELLARLLAGMEARVEDWCAGRFAELHEAWLAVDSVLGRTLRVETSDSTWVARAHRVTEAGLLEMELVDGSRREIAAGEVHLA